MENRTKLLWASFLTLIAAGMGFAIRNNILGDWASSFGFTMVDLGTITGGGLTGFGVIILFGSLFVDRVGYKAILVIAFLLHLISAAITLAATPIYNSGDGGNQSATYWCLYWGMFLFAVANGLCEAVINPLVATLYPKQKTHYLNILHAGWPGGLILGAVLGYIFVGDNIASIAKLKIPWEIPMMFFLVPVAMYGWVILKEKFPHSEAKVAGVSFGQMLLQFASPLLLFLLLLHAMVGYVELGTDSWIMDILKSVISGQAVLLFIYTSAIMFVLRFFAGPIVERINPIGLLFVSAILGCIGLYWLSTTQAALMLLAAATVYGVGKTFLWPTMLGVVGERFPKGGALVMGAMGGVGMLSAGLLGGPGIGYKQDYFASHELQSTNPEVYQEYVDQAPFSEKLNRFVKPDEMENGSWPASFGVVEEKPVEKRFLFFPPTTALNGKKVGEVTELAQEPDGREKMSQTQLDVLNARIYGGQMALRWTALVPLMMAVGYLILLIYFRMKGGYKQEVLHGAEPVGEHYTGGVEGPVE